MITNTYLVKKGIANNFGSHIEIHEGLLKYPKLFKRIMIHELSHSKDWGFNDFRQDFKFHGGWKYWKFVLANPSSWCQFIPWYKSVVTKEWYYDKTLGLFYALVFAMIGSILLLRGIL